MSRVFALVCLLASTATCTSAPSEPTPAEADPSVRSGAIDGVTQQSDFATSHSSFTSYWNAGLAEITRYELVQTRYGQPRRGDLVFVFVTEPFLPSEQVKHEVPDGAADLEVLKLNAVRTFSTGIYPYTIMTSSFSPTQVRGDAMMGGIKVTSTVTEWCGQAFAQLNRREGFVAAELRSYFQQEGDRDERIDDAPYEDAIWQTIRRDPESLPLGETEMIPAMHALRLYHQPLRAYDVTATIEDASRDGEAVKRYRLRYEELARELVIDFEPAFPFAIIGFEETTRGERTTASRTHAIMDAYWGHNTNADARLRAALGLVGQAR